MLYADAGSRNSRFKLCLVLAKSLNSQTLRRRKRRWHQQSQLGFLKDCSVHSQRPSVSFAFCIRQCTLVIIQVEPCSACDCKSASLSSPDMPYIACTCNPLSSYRSYLYGMCCMLWCTIAGGGTRKVTAEANDIPIQPRTRAPLQLRSGSQRIKAQAQTSGTGIQRSSVTSCHQA
jgi:hypothetical protein